MKTYITAAVIAVLIAVGWWLRWDAVRDYKAKLAIAAHEHAMAMEVAKREHDETRRKLKAETGRRLAAVQAIGMGRGDCYRLDDPLPDGLARILRDSDSR